MTTVANLMTEEIEMRILGQYVTLTRSAWLDLLDDLIPASELAHRIRARLGA